MVRMASKTTSLYVLNDNHRTSLEKSGGIHFGNILTVFFFIILGGNCKLSNFNKLVIKLNAFLHLNKSL